jgi:hypothetical protein
MIKLRIFSTLQYFLKKYIFDEQAFIHHFVAVTNDSVFALKFMLSNERFACEYPDVVFACLFFI